MDGGSILRTITVGTQSNMFGEDRVIKLNKFDIPIEELRGMVLENMSECHACGEELRIGGKQDRVIEVYDNPWDDLTRELHVHNNKYASEYYMCDEIIATSGWRDFHYEHCEGCERLVIVRNPKNGWDGYFRYEDGEATCLKCYGDMLLEEGMDRQRVEEGHIPGMMFSYSQLEVVDAGYESVDRLFVNGYNSRNTCDMILGIMDEGYKVMVAYERMSILGDEGYVQIYKKEVESETSNVQAKSG